MEIWRHERSYDIILSIGYGYKCVPLQDGSSNILKGYDFSFYISAPTTHEAVKYYIWVENVNLLKIALFYIFS